MTGEGETDLVHLLPPFASERLYRFPRVNTDVARTDCFFSSGNFFNTELDSGFLDQSYFTNVLNTRFRKVSTPTYGDLILLARPVDNDWEAIHAAIYLAGDIAFTKNGSGVPHPWMLSTIADMEAEYGFAVPVKTTFFRERSDLPQRDGPPSLAQ